VAWRMWLMCVPRLHGRGPIEAQSMARMGRQGKVAFRGFTAAAPLKREEVRERLILLGRVPRLHGRGPIEAPGTPA